MYPAAICSVRIRNIPSRSGGNIFPDLSTASITTPGRIWPTAPGVLSRTLAGAKGPGGVFVVPQARGRFWVRLGGSGAPGGVLGGAIGAVKVMAHTRARAT